MPKETEVKNLESALGILEVSGHCVCVCVCVCWCMCEGVVEGKGFVCRSVTQWPYSVITRT